jgi:hypothetical protein
LNTRGLHESLGCSHISDAESSEFAGKSEERRRHGRLGEGERIILMWIFRKYGVRMWSGFIWLKT